jgi:hypothetical protein
MYVRPSQMTTSVVVRTLARAVPGRVPAPASGAGETRALRLYGPAATLTPAAPCFPPDFGVHRVLVDPGHGAANNKRNTSCFCVDEPAPLEPLGRHAGDLDPGWLLPAVRFVEHDDAAARDRHVASVEVSVVVARAADRQHEHVGGAVAVTQQRGHREQVGVAEVLRALWPTESPPSYAALRASESDGVARYELLLSDEGLARTFGDLGAQLETALRQNPNYDLARRLGQLQPLRVIQVAAARAREELAAHRGRLGDAKPKVLLRVCDGIRGCERP